MVEGGLVPRAPVVWAFEGVPEEIPPEGEEGLEFEPPPPLVKPDWVPPPEEEEGVPVT